MSFTQMFDAIEKKAEQNTMINEGDYIGKDGLWVCGKCHTPKQVRVAVMGIEKTPFALCKCEAQKRDAEREAIRKASLIKELKREVFPACKYNSNPDEDLSSCTFANDKGYQPELMRKAKNYVEDFEHYKSIGKGLLFYGEPGVGKSYAAACIANELVSKGIPVIMTDFATIAAGLSETYEKRRYYSDLNNCSLLILDDLAAERDTQYMKEIIHKVINDRIASGLPMIITSNLTWQELANPAGMNDKRLFSRLIKACHLTQVKGDDLRKKEMVDTFAEMERMLNR